MGVFTRLLRIDCPTQLDCEALAKSPTFRVVFTADGEIPFPQVILHGQGMQKLIKNEAICLESQNLGEWVYVASVPGGLLGAGEITLQVEGCRKADISQASGEDWVKAFRPLHICPPTTPKPHVRMISASPGEVEAKIYFGIHKHMHQPYYNTTDRYYWDGEKDGIFGSRVGNYTDYIPAAVRQYIDGDLAHAGLSTSWSGSLIEQLDRCSVEGLCGGRFAEWNKDLRAIAQEKTKLGNPRIAFSAFGFFHPLMPLMPNRDIVRQIAWHRGIVHDSFGVEASKVLFPPETAFHVRMIPALIEAGVTAVIYDSIHRFRACRDYPYAGLGEGMLPPNPAEQTNPAVDDWLQLHNIWAGSQISPSLLRPEYVVYEDPDGKRHKIIAVPAERYIGNEDARGGFGALQYADVLGQVYDQLLASGAYDPKHPPFFLLHSDGDNHGGGADSYYKHNTGRLVEWLHQDRRFELCTVEDYLQQFPPNPANEVHIEPGSWSGADNGDPQFMKWFSRYDQPYSPDLNSWAVLTAFQNTVHTLEDGDPDHPQLADAIRLLLTAETSCYWYWTGQEVWDGQVTHAANKGYAELKQALANLLETGVDRTGPAIFPPWVTPENPGGKKWGQGCLVDAPREGVAHTLVYDVFGLKRVDLVLRSATGESVQPMRNHGPYPSRTKAALTAEYYTADLPIGAGDVRYYVEAEDRCGNVSRSALERIYLA
ncbi:MAG: glycosyl hydrolase family 57 [Methylococcaceae bacterium]|nr:glycosyl hydrolase family 57 [Methylococcaceae bacterium]